MTLGEELTKIGLNSKEAKLYLELLAHGPLTQQELSNNTGILRQTVYDMMPNMENKGYVSFTVSGKRKYYSAIDPKTLVSNMKSTIDQFSSHLSEFSKITSQSMPSSHTFVGIKGLKNFFSQSLESKSEILWTINKSFADKIFYGYYWHNYAQKRIDKRIPIRLLIESTKDRDWDTDKSVKRMTRRHGMMNNELTSFLVYDNVVIIFSQQEENLNGTAIKDIIIADFFKKVFEKFWSEAK
jgi:HTH-type transcriptional regulator, sugar sensing transcriptional regulator